jgi:DNA-binding NtrC family response regulator
MPKPVRPSTAIPPRPADAPTVEQIAARLRKAGLNSVWLEDLHWAVIENAPVAHCGNRTRAARSLGISVRTLQRKLRAWGIQENPPPIRGAVRSRRSLTRTVDHPDGLM